MQLIHISVGGGDFRIKMQDGALFLFEDHPIFGPLILNRDGSSKEKQPGEKSPFWKAHRYWSLQGKVVDIDGFCKWQLPPPLKVIKVFKNQYRIAKEHELHLAEDFHDDT